MNIRAFNNGDEGSLQQVFHLYYSSLNKYAFRIIQNRQQAEDIVAEAFRKLWDNRGKFETEQKIKGFLFKCIRNDCFYFKRDSKPPIPLNFEPGVNYYEQVSNEEDPELKKQLLLQAAFAEIEKLPPRRKQVFRMRCIDRLDRNEVAKQLNISVSTVDTHVDQAREQIEANLKAKGIPPTWLLFFLV